MREKDGNIIVDWQTVYQGETERLERKVMQLESDLLTKTNELFAVTTDRDEWRLSTQIANKVIKQHDQDYKEAFRLRKTLEAIAAAANMAEVSQILKDAAIGEKQNT